MHQSDDLLLDLPTNQHDYKFAFIHSQASLVPEHVRQLFEEYKQNLMADVAHRNSAYLLRLHQYYDGIIAELKERIQMLKVELAKSQLLIENKRSKQKVTPCSPAHPPCNKEENCSPVTIDFRLQDQDQEESLLDDLPTSKPKINYNPKLVESIIFDSLDEAPTTKKQGRRSTVQKVAKPSRFLKDQFDEVKSESGNYVQQGPFQAELKVVKQELAALRESLIQSGLQIQEGKEQVMPKQICIQLLQMEQSRNVKEHLTNQNTQLRKQAINYRQQLFLISPELQALKEILMAALDE